MTHHSCRMYDLGKLDTVSSTSLVTMTWLFVPCAQFSLIIKMFMFSQKSKTIDFCNTVYKIIKLCITKHLSNDIQMYLYLVTINLLTELDKIFCKQIYTVLVKEY